MKLCLIIITTILVAHIFSDEQSVIDPATGKNITSDYLYQCEADYYHTRDSLFEQLKTETNKVNDSSALKKAIQELKTLQTRTEFSMKGMIPSHLPQRFEKDLQTISLIYSNKESLKTLEEIYYESRALEGPVIIPPQIDPDYFQYLQELETNKRLDRLIPEFLACQIDAHQKPGEMKNGNIALGAPDTLYFNPSEEANRLSEIGHSIQKIFSSIDSREELTLITRHLLSACPLPNKLIFSSIRYYHVDVVGSGRFIYPENPVECQIDLIEPIIQKYNGLYAKQQGDIEMPTQKLGLQSEQENCQFLSELWQEMTKP